VSQNRTSPHRLDPRTPLVVDTRELGRRPGSMRTLLRTAPAPERLGVDLIGVPPGAELELDLRLESVVEGVLVSGTATVPLSGECGRCLEPVVDEMTVDLQELYLYEGDDRRHRGTSPEDAEEETSRMEGDLLDLEPVLRDAVVLALPLTPLCREDCSGLCAECGARLDDLPAGERDQHAHGAPDPRWAGLEGLRTIDTHQEN
jgi:uncharacterized protein